MTTLLSRFDAKNRASAASIQAHLFELCDAVPSEPGYLSYGVFSAREERDTFWVLEDESKLYPACLGAPSKLVMRSATSLLAGTKTIIVRSCRPSTPKEETSKLMVPRTGWRKSFTA